jgi:hypothetical protein
MPEESGAAPGQAGEPAPQRWPTPPSEGTAGQASSTAPGGSQAGAQGKTGGSTGGPAPSGGATGGSPGAGPVTGEDRRAQIDRRFDETFAVFDERMRKEQEAVSQERASRGTGSASGSGAAEGEAGTAGEGGAAASGELPGGSGSGPGSERTGAPGTRGESAGGQSGEQGGGGGVGGGTLGGSGPNTVPADIPDGRDDDIVARQLREAAMKETDPELRERLWEEYRQYKKSTQ